VRSCVDDHCAVRSVWHSGEVTTPTSADTAVDPHHDQQHRTLNVLRFAVVPGNAAVAGMVAVVSLLAKDMLGSDRLAPALREAAMSLSGARARCSVREFGEVLVASLDLGSALDVDLGVDPFASGAVALDLAVRAPAPRRSVLTARTLVATDSEWQVGTGPALPATASSIVLFLAGRGGVPPRVEEP